MELKNILIKKNEIDYNNQNKETISIIKWIEQLRIEIQYIKYEISSSLDKKYLNNGLFMCLNYQYNNYLFNKIEDIENKIKILEEDVNKGKNNLTQIQIKNLKEKKFFENIEKEKILKNLRQDYYK
jgi:hypothetical protein